LVQGSDGNYYGTTYGGGASNLGTIFQMTPDGRLTTLYSFKGGSEGATPIGGLLQSAGDGNFYGMTSAGGTHNLGTIFRFPMPVTIQRVTQAGGMITFTWGAVAGRTYQLQTEVDVVQGVWTNSGPSITATNVTATGSDTIAADPQRFYRLVLLP
jgi:uncharacterized repeat protein (TIGR03803 family)